jgi:hypothetical protein
MAVNCSTPSSGRGKSRSATERGAGGRLAGQGTPPNLTDTPSLGFAGQDQFQFRAQSPLGSADATVTVEVTENSAKPIAAAQTRQPWANNTLAVPLEDRDHDELTAVAAAAPLNNDDASSAGG